MDILKRAMAPIGEQGWQEIETEVKRVLNGNLAARGLVDFTGPSGWEKSAVNLGTMRLGKKELVKGVEWGLREVMPLLEARIPFALDVWELDNISRGAEAPELDPAGKAAQKAALFEESVIYHGFPNAGFKGICEDAAAVSLPSEAADFEAAVEDAIFTLQKHGVEGPYQLALGDEPYRKVMAGDGKGYPLHRRLRELLGNDLKWSPALEDGVLFSRRGGDFIFTCGQDLSIGYHKHDAKKVELFLTESFAFQVLEPAAAVILKKQ